MNDRRRAINKLNTLLFGKDLRITKGDVYSEIRPFDYSSYYPEDDYIRDQLPPEENVYDIRHFGADVNAEDNAGAISVAVSLAAETGGTVLVRGGTYVTTTVYLQSNVTLFIERGAALSANKTGEGYRHQGILHAENCDNITLTGGGKICGMGEYFGLKPLWDENMLEHPSVIDVVQMRRDSRAQLRFAHPSKYGGAIYFKNCTNVKADNFIIESAAHWSFHLEGCDGVTIENFVINNNRHVANTDGFDIVDSRNMTIHHCFVSTADDGICLKNAVWLGSRQVMEHIAVSDCEVITRANAFKIGTETTHDIRHITVENCSFLMTDLYPGTVSGIAVESADGSVVSDVRVKNIKMSRVTCPIFIRLCNRNRAALVTAESANAVEFGQKKKKGGIAEKDTYDMRGAVQDITVENITATGVEVPVIVAGFKQKNTVKCVENVTLRNIDMQYAPYKEVYDKRAFIPEYSDVYPESWRFRNLPAYALWARHVRGLRLENFRCSLPRSTWKKEIILEDVEKI